MTVNWSWLDNRPLVVAIAGPNGAGKTTFYHAHVASTDLHFVNTDRLAAELQLDPYLAARAADGIRREMVNQHVSFAFETVFSDPVGDKLEFLESCAANGYTTALFFVGLASARLSVERVAMRVSQGGHDVPIDKLTSRYPRTLATPYRQLAVFENGSVVEQVKSMPKWLREILRKG